LINNIEIVERITGSRSYKYLQLGRATRSAGLAQMFLPPPWLRGSDLRDLLSIQGLGYRSHLENFRDVVKAKEKEKGMHCQGSGREEKIPLSKLWDGIYNLSNFLIGQALLRLDVAGDVY